MIRAAKLDLAFDARRLEAELRAVPRESWEKHFNPAYYQGDWSGVALRSNSGHMLKLYIDPNPKAQFYETEAAAATPYVFECLRSLGCDVRAVRFMQLGPGATIQEHRDVEVSIHHAEARLHVPIVTNEATEFVIDNESIPMRPGECWYVNVDLPHRVANRGTTDRVHLVVDVAVNDWLRTVVARPPTDRRC